MAIVFQYHNLPTSGTISTADIREGFTLAAANNNYGNYGNPTSLRAMAPPYGVSTSGTVDLRDFIGKSLKIGETETGGGGGPGL